jgi:hypothetical protein
MVLGNVKGWPKMVPALTRCMVWLGVELAETDQAS